MAWAWTLHDSGFREEIQPGENALSSSVNRDNCVGGILGHSRMTSLSVVMRVGSIGVSIERSLAKGHLMLISVRHQAECLVCIISFNLCASLISQLYR